MPAEAQNLEDEDCLLGGVCGDLQGTCPFSRGQPFLELGNELPRGNMATVLPAISIFFKKKLKIHILF